MTNAAKYECPVCRYPGLEDPPENHEICPSCGTQFGYHDARRSHAELREMWLSQGAKWHSRVVPRPIWWNPYPPVTVQVRVVSEAKAFNTTTTNMDLRFHSSGSRAQVERRESPPSQEVALQINGPVYASTKPLDRTLRAS